MNSSLTLVVCFTLSLFSRVNGVPARAPGEVNFAEFRALSIKLNEMARDLYNNVDSPNMTSIIDDSPVSIRPIDTCDPWSLQTNKERCQTRIVLALKNYTRLFHWDGVFKNSACSKWREQANEIAEVSRKLLQTLKQPTQQPEDAPLIAVNWPDSALCRDSVERLYSFSIVSARVFSFLASPVKTKVEVKQC